MPESILDSSLSSLPLDAFSGQPLDEYRGLIELVGLPPTGAVANVDLTIGDACSYQAPILANPFFADIASDPRFSDHKAEATRSGAA